MKRFNLDPNKYSYLIFFCFSEKYEWVGRLLRDGEEHRNYSDEEEEVATDGSGEKAKDA